MEYSRARVTFVLGLALVMRLVSSSFKVHTSDFRTVYRTGEKITLVWGMSGETRNAKDYVSVSAAQSSTTEGVCDSSPHFSVSHH